MAGYWIEIFATWPLKLEKLYFWNSLIFLKIWIARHKWCCSRNPKKLYQWAILTNVNNWCEFHQNRLTWAIAHLLFCPGMTLREDVKDVKKEVAAVRLTAAIVTPTSQDNSFLKDMPCHDASSIMALESCINGCNVSFDRLVSGYILASALTLYYKSF